MPGVGKGLVFITSKQLNALLILRHDIVTIVEEGICTYILLHSQYLGFHGFASMTIRNIWQRVIDEWYVNWVAAIA